MQKFLTQEQSVIIYIDQYNQIQTKFDKIVSSEKNQKQMFVNIEPYINQILNGYNLTIFAYGQTGSGKTYTMFGKDWENSFQQLQKSKKGLKQNTPLTDIPNDEHYAGLIPRSAYHIFQCLQRFPKQFNVFCSFLQIYNEKVYDLLQDSPVPTPLSIHQSKFEGIFVQGLGQFQIHQYIDCLQLIRRGEKNRFIRQTSMNAKSSRSHTIFQILIQSAKSNQNGTFTRARLNLCDLAGSQKINKKQHMINEHLQELKNINLSLTTLGKVINSLSKGSNTNYAIFRQSKLTRLLQQSLTRNTNTFIVGAISPSSKNKDQTLNTLKFVERAKHITLTIKPSTIGNQGQIVSRLKQQMQQLRKIVQQKQKMGMPKELKQKLLLLQQQNRKLKNETENKNQDINELLQQNRKIKQALGRMEKVAMDQLSNATLQMSIDGQEFKQTNSKFRKSFMLNEQKLLPNPQQPERYDKSKLQYLPPIIDKKNKLNRSVQLQESMMSARRPAITLDLKQKKKIISNLELLQTKQKMQQIKLMKSLQTIQENQRVKSEHIRGKSEGLITPKNSGYSTLEKNNLKMKSKKKEDYLQKIKQMENRLKKSNR